jgi:hypothetical protein
MASSPRLSNTPESISSVDSFEPFVDAERVAKFLSTTRRQVLEMARREELPAHPLGQGRRRRWRFRLSEVGTAVAARGGVSSEAPVVLDSPRRQKEKSR